MSKGRRIRAERKARGEVAPRYLGRGGPVRTYPHGTGESVLREIKKRQGKRAARTEPVPA